MLTVSSELTLGKDPAGRQWLLNGVSAQQNVLLSFRGWQYAAFYATVASYNSNSKVIYVHLARRAVERQSWEIFAFDDYEQTTDDGHNTIQIGICEGDGTIHLAFDHHDDNLHYRYSQPGLALDPKNIKWDASTFTQTSDKLPGTGSTITRLTYPRFLVVGKDMLFSHRTGMAGLGSEILYEYSSQTGKYTCLGTYLEGIENNPYINGLDYHNSRLHVTWTYRDFVYVDSPHVGTSRQAGPNGVENNHDLWYSYSDDLGRSWKNSDGLTVASLEKNEPVRPNSGGTRVFTIPKNSEVHNQEDQVVDHDGGVHVLNRDTMGGHLQWKHYYRSPSGTWTQTPLPHGAVLVGGKRGIMAVTKENDIYFILPENKGTNSADRVTGELVILKATKRGD